MSDAQRRGIPIGLMMQNPQMGSKILELWKTKPKATPHPPKVDEADRRLSVFQRLAAKAIRGGTTPPPGMIRWGALPDAVRAAADTGETHLGWDPETLDPEERLLLQNLVLQGQKEVEARTETSQATAETPPPRSGGGS